MLISLLGPLTMACFNPARDFAPRIYSSLAGWGRVPFETNGVGWLTVYIVAPGLGGLLGGAIYRLLFKPAYASLSVPEYSDSQKPPTRGQRAELPPAGRVMSREQQLDTSSLQR
jgi:glycerol uptake facilitator protein